MRLCLNALLDSFAIIAIGLISVVLTVFVPVAVLVGG